MARWALMDALVGRRSAASRDGERRTETPEERGVALAGRDETSPPGDGPPQDGFIRAESLCPRPIEGRGDFERI